MRVFPVIVVAGTILVCHTHILVASRLHHNNLLYQLYIQKILVYARLCASIYLLYPEDQFAFVSEFSCDDRQKGKKV